MSEHTNSSIAIAKARAIEAAKRLALPPARGEVNDELVSRDEALQHPTTATESTRRTNAVAVVLDEGRSNRGDREKRTTGHRGTIARCSWAFLPRCEVPRRWRADETGDRGTPVPTGNRSARRARARRRQVAQGRGPHRTVGAPCAAEFGPQSHVNAPGGSGGLPPGTVHTCKHLVRAQESCSELSAECEGSNRARRPVYPRQRWNVWAWRRRVAKELDAIVSAMPQGKRTKGLSHRSRKLRSCGTVVRVRECGCGAARAGSARYAHPCDDETKTQGIPMPCEARSCWLCQRRRATPLREWLAKQVKTLRLPDGFAWSFLTVSPQYAPDDRDELSPRGLRARLDALRAAVRAIVREGRDAIHGAFVAFELAGTGHVHAHVMLAARYLDCDWIDRTAARAGAREVHIHIERAGVETAAEVAKYVAKLISPLDEAALTGAETREMMAPELCAAWEVATYGARMHERFGALRKAPMDEGGAPPAPQDAQEPCHACGTIGHWHWGLRPTRAWVIECHKRGQPAFEASMQLARRERERVPLWDQCFNGATRNPIPSRGRARRSQ